MLETVSENIECRCFEEAADVLIAIRETDEKPNLFVVDLYVPGSDVPSFIRNLREICPDAKILIVSASNSVADRNQVIEAGASLFLNKDSEPETLVDAVESLLEGQIPQNQPIASKALAEKYMLTSRQLEILVLASKGLSNKEIAQILNISPETIKSHISDILQRFGVSNRMEAVDYARSRGLS